jgi:CrcB protein
MLPFIAVFIGGGFGALIRFVISLLFNRYFVQSIPYGTLFANILGCFLIGFLMALFSKRVENENIKLFFTTGMMGGLTTFSTFSFETTSLIISNNYDKALVYSLSTFLFCLILTFMSFKYFNNFF